MSYTHPSHILALNSGSSSIKFDFYRMTPAPEAVIEGEIDHLNSDTRSR